MSRGVLTRSGMKARPGLPSRVDPQRVTAEGAEAPKPARQDNDLLMLPCTAEGVEHSLNAVIVTINQRVVEDDGNGATRGRCG
jgi:hypothetical protein